MKEYLYYTYNCQPSSETRGKRTSTPVSDPCGRKSLLQTSKEITHESRHQGKCIHCGNRPRLTPANTTLYDSEEEAYVAVIEAYHEVVQ